MLDKIWKNTAEYKDAGSQDEQKSKGQFFTSPDTVRYMAGWYRPASRAVSILDPGAGNGSLAASVVERLVRDSLCDDIRVTYIENDARVLPVLKQTVRYIRDFCKKRGVVCRIEVLEKNYILADVNDSYDLVICNPPYKKIRKDSKESEKMREYVYGQPNIYALFMAKSYNLLKDGGSFVFITPRSWLSGNYFSRVRELLARGLSFDKIHVFSERDKSFSSESVLQETMILFATRRKQQESVEISISSDDSFTDVDSITVPAKQIKDIGKDRYVLIPANVEETNLVRKMAKLPNTFGSLGYVFRTGPVVEFRNRDVISTTRKPNYVPMYRALNVADDKLVFPVQTAKAQYVSSDAKKLLIKNENTVFIRRLSAKEESRRIQSCVYYRQGDSDFISVENHVNYVSRADGEPLSNAEVEWIQKLLSSREYDTYFRLLNGSTQVNASELNQLPVKGVEV